MSFTEEKLNVKNNLLPNHGGPTVNAVLEEEETEMVSLVGDLKTLLSVISTNLQKHEVLVGVHDNCGICKTESDKCEELKVRVQELVNQGVLSFARARVVEEVSVIDPIEIVYYKKKIEAPTKKIQPINIRVPALFPYQHSKAVPWKYDVTISVGGKEIQFSEAEIVNIADIMSFSEEKLNVKNNSLPNHGGPTVNTVLEEEETEMVSLVGDLKTLLSVISANLQKHEVLVGVHDNCGICKTESDKCEELKVRVQELMNQGVLSFARARVMEEVSVIDPIEIVYYKKKIEAPTKKIQPINIRVPALFPYQHSKAVPWKYDVTISVGGKEIQFSEAEIVNIADTLISRVLVDTCSSLNVLPKSKLSQLQFEGPKIWASVLIVRAFGGSRREVVREVDLPILVGTHQFTVTFQVMDIYPAYIFLLGRPWIHVVGVVTSILHQKLKFTVGDKHMIVCGEEDFVIIRREVKIGASLAEHIHNELIKLLREYVDFFAWSYQDMPWLDTKIVEHQLPLKPECPPVKQKLRRTRPDMALKIREEVKNKFDTGFLAIVEYPQCVANIVLVPKKDGKVRMCVDYRDLNKGSMKDDFPLPHIDVLVDNT
ncbi:uncharacterized protein LOC127081173 [Lathyrus oleraceus]|uniref:uncharacterized protein LOC127081173 n=1 Tax=Pisum sativum TaxID=3888 RepID=UPI0021CE10BD|nr:uncharacterized protein LOC127081173 [Pisum sativum]